MNTGIILIIVSFIIIVVALIFLITIRRIAAKGIEVNGIIFDMEIDARSDNNIYYPVVRFLTKNNEWITKSNKIGVIPGMYKKGKEVTVVYQNNNPNNFFVKDKFTYLIPCIILITGVILAIVGVSYLLRV